MVMMIMIWLWSGDIWYMNTSGDPGIKTLPSNAEGAGSIIGWEANIPNVSRPSQKKKKKKNP